MTVALRPQHGALRAARGTGLAVVNAVLAVAAHVAGGGDPPDRVLTVLISLGVAAAGTALADRRRGPFALLAAVAVSQVMLHLLLGALSGPHGTVAPAPVGATMLAAHAAAVLVTAALLAGAESALFVVADALRRIAGTVPLLTSAPRDDRRAVAMPVGTALPAALQRLLCLVTPLRGPPAPH